MPIPGLESFRDEMEKRIKEKNEEFGEQGWHDMGVLQLDARVREQAQELHAALLDQKVPVSRVVTKAVDVANLAFMVADWMMTVFPQKHPDSPRLGQSSEEATEPAAEAYGPVVAEAPNADRNTIPAQGPEWR